MRRNKQLPISPRKAKIILRAQTPPPTPNPTTIRKPITATKKEYHCPQWEKQLSEEPSKWTGRQQWDM